MRTQATKDINVQIANAILSKRALFSTARFFLSILYTSGISIQIAEAIAIITPIPIISPVLLPYLSGLPCPLKFTVIFSGSLFHTIAK